MSSPVSIGTIQQYDGVTGQVTSPWLGQSVAVQGTLYLAPGAIDDSTCQIQDATGGLRVRLNADPGAAVGWSVMATGVVATDPVSGEIQLDDADIVLQEVVPVPYARRVPLEGFRTDFELVGAQVTIYGHVAYRDTTGFGMTAGTDTVHVAVDPDRGWDPGQPVPGDFCRVDGAASLVGSHVQLIPLAESSLLVDPPQSPFRVAHDGSGDFATIQEAIYGSLDGDIIELENGTFSGWGNRDLSYLGMALEIRSVAGDPALCLIDCDGTPAEPHRGFLFTSGEDSTSVLRGIAVVDGYADLGGAVSIAAGAHPKFVACEFSGNHASQSGGALAHGYTGGSTDGWAVFVDCVFRENSATNRGGAVVLAWPASTEFRNCEFTGNSAANGGAAWAATHAIATFRDCQFTGNLADDSGGALSGYDEGYFNCAGCTFALNEADRGGAVFVTSVNGKTGTDPMGIESMNYNRYEDCDFSGNTARLGGAMYIDLSPTGPFTAGSTFLDNSAIDGGAVYFRHNAFSAGSSVTDAVFARNTAQRGGAVFLGNNDWSMTTGEYLNGCTLVENIAPQGAGVFIQGGRPVVPVIRNTIIARGVGAAFHCEDDEPVTLANCNIHRFSGGDWTGPLATQLGVGGNISLDPLFCDPCLADYGLAANSPCDAANNPTGIRIGAMPVVCGEIVPPATLLHVDVQPDAVGAAWSLAGPGCYAHDGNGDETLAAIPAGSYTLTWKESGCWVSPVATTCLFTLEEGLALTVTGVYGDGPTIQAINDVANDQGRQVRLVWRRSVHDSAESSPPVTGYGIYRRQGDAKMVVGPRDAAAKIVGWDFVATVPARADSLYQHVASTLCDSTAEGGLCWSVFMISAMTAAPAVFYDSLPDSGWSVDNIAPAAPTGLRREAGTMLVWEASTAADFHYFTVFGAAVAYRDGSETLVEHTIGTSVDVDGLAHAYFLVTSTDSQGNESAAAALDVVSGVTDSAAMTLRMHPCQPNPFNPRTTIRFDLPQAGPVRISVFDLAGRMIRSLVDEGLSQGSHEAVWDGRDASGREVGSGTYLARLEFGGKVETVRMGLIK